MAYVLGYFTADGNMIRNKRGAHYIEFQSTDKELIYSVRSLLNSNLKVSSYKRKENHKTVYRIQIGSKVMYSDLEHLGFMPNKSLKVKLPNIPSRYFTHFVRGYFDGDGCVNYSYYRRTDRKNSWYGALQVQFVSGCKNFLDDLYIRLREEASLQGGTRCFSKGYRLAYSKFDSIRLFAFLYNDMRHRLYLKRKFVYFQKALRAIDSFMQKSK